MSAHPVKLDATGAACHFESHDCSRLALGHGGFDQHHPDWIELGGDPAQPHLLVVCPLHHRRQHALGRYLAECILDGVAEAWDVLRAFTLEERKTARASVASWQARGAQRPKSWPCPAARAV